MASVDLTTLRLRVRLRADMEVSDFVSDTANSLDSFINEGVQQLHGMLVEAMGEEYKSSTSSFTGVSQQSDYNLPSDFYKLYRVTLSNGSGPVRTLTPFNRSEAGAYDDSLLALQPVPRYQLTGSILRLLPRPVGGEAGVIYYAPEATKLVAGSDAVNFPNGWETWVVLYAAIQAKIKEEGDVQELRNEKMQLERAIEQAKEQRDLANAHQSVDMDLVDFDRIFRWRA